MLVLAFRLLVVLACFVCGVSALNTQSFHTASFHVADCMCYASNSC